MKGFQTVECLTYTFWIIFLFVPFSFLTCIPKIRSGGGGSPSDLFICTDIVYTIHQNTNSATFFNPLIMNESDVTIPHLGFEEGG